MFEAKSKSSSFFHLAGIVPVAGQKLDFNFPWHDCLQPISQNYLAVERAVVECAYAGCKSIWIVCHDDMQPLIRYRLGEYVKDPVYIGRREHGTDWPIPIQYVPVHPEDRDKRDCLSWSVIYGALCADRTSRSISKWTAPDRYYVAFPYGVYNPEILREHRKSISSERAFFLTHNNKTVKDNEYLGFTFTPQEAVQFKNDVRKKGTGLYVGAGVAPGEFPREKLPIEKRYSARHFSLDTVFESAILKDALKVELSWYNNIDTWDGLKKYLASNNQAGRPSKAILSYHEFNKIGE